MDGLFCQIQAAVGNLVIGLWHLISFPLSRRSRWRSLRMWNVALNPFVLEQIPLSRFLPDAFVVTLGPVKAGEHNVSEYELLALACLVKGLGAEMIFEIGTFDGRSSRAIAMNVSAAGRLVTLNLPPGADCNDSGLRNVDSLLNLKVVSGCKFIGTPEEVRISQVFGDSLTFDFTPYHKMMDLVFIDGSHSRNYVEKDTESALSMLKPSGGWIVWHDAPLYDVAPFLRDQIRKQGWELRLIQGTTLAVGYAAGGRMMKWPENLGSVTST